MPLLVLGECARAATPLQPVQVRPLDPFRDQSGLWSRDKVSTQPGSDSFQQDLNSTSGLAYRERGSPTLSIRGSGQSGRVLTMVDGVPLNSATGIGSQILLLPTENLESATVIRSPASVFYGTSAMAGLFQVQTEELQRVRYRAKYLSYDELFGTQVKTRYLAAPLHRSVNSHLQASIYSQQDSGTYQYQSADPNVRARRDFNGSHVLRTHIKGRQNLGRWALEESLVLAESQQKSPGSTAVPISAVTQTSAQVAALGVQHRLAKGHDVGLRVSHLGEQLVSESLGVRTQTRASSQQFTFRYEASETPLQPELSLTQRVDTLESSYLVDSGRLRMEQPEAGLRLNFPAGPDFPNWKGQTGIRYLAAFGQWLAALGTFYEKGPTKAWLQFSEGFRAPTLTDRYARELYYAGNPALQPEKSRSVEGGFRHSLSGASLYDRQGFFVGGSVFQTHYDQLIEYETNNLVLSPKNRGQARVQGVETEWGYQGPRWSTAMNLDFTESVDLRTFQRLRLTPQHRAVLRGDYQIGILRGELRFTYWSDYLDQRVSLDSRSGEMMALGPWQTWDLRVSTVHLANVQVQFSVLNIFNQQRQFTFGFPEPGRTFFLSAQRDF